MTLGGGEKYAVGLGFVRFEEVVDEMRRLRDEVRDEESADDKPADHASEEYHGERLNPTTMIDWALPHTGRRLRLEVERDAPEE
jgi:hypothetical protein